MTSEERAKRIEEAAANVTRYVGCGDNSCLFVKPKGMATNGGCRCGERRPFVMAALAQLYRVALEPAPPREPRASARDALATEPIVAELHPVPQPEEAFSDEKACRVCGKYGWTYRPGHFVYCTPEKCGAPPPAPSEECALCRGSGACPHHGERCPRCGGTGRATKGKP